MSDPKRVTLITVGAPKSVKNNVRKTVRLTINLDESNESKYPELNYRELVIVEERRKRQENGKTAGLDPFSDNDDDVEREARKFEQKYGGKSTYGRKGRSKMDEFADIGAGYDETDSFIDNTHGYDEMIPPDRDTLHGGFYINCGDLEFKNLPKNQLATSDGEAGGNRRNKRRISSSSSEEDSSESSSESESAEEKDPKVIANGAVDSHKTEHRKKKNKKIDKNKAKKVRRTDSSAATSGKQTSDDNAGGDADSGDSRSSRSDSLASKPPPSSETAATSDSSRDVESKCAVELPASVTAVLDAIEAAVAQLPRAPPAPPALLLRAAETHVARLDRVTSQSGLERAGRRAAWARAAALLRTSRAALLHELRQPRASTPTTIAQATPAPAPPVPPAPCPAATPAPPQQRNKRKQDEFTNKDYSHLSSIEREVFIVETLHRLQELIDERKPAMIASYNAECERVQEERKKIQIASASEGGPVVEKRLPKRRFPWCGRARALVGRLARLAGGGAAGAALLAARALPLFPAGFVRMPTLLRQADLSKELKVSELKRQRLGSSHGAAPPAPPPAPPEPIHFPSSLTVTTSTKPPLDRAESVHTDDSKYKPNVLNNYTARKDLEKPERKEEKLKDDLYVPPNSIGSITITPVVNQKTEPKLKQDKGVIRVRSPAALNDLVQKEEKPKKIEKNHTKDKMDVLHVDTSITVKEVPKPNEVSQKQIESMRIAENNIPRPALVPVHHSPTFAKPDKRPPEVKKKKDVVIVSDLDPLADSAPEPLSVDDSSSDVELIEDKTEKSDKCEVPSKDKNSQKKMPNKKVDTDRQKSDEANKDIETIIRTIKQMEHSQEQSKMNSSNSYGGIPNAKQDKSAGQHYSRDSFFADGRSAKDKLTNFFKENGWM